MKKTIILLLCIPMLLFTSCKQNKPKTAFTPADYFNTEGYELVINDTSMILNFFNSYDELDEYRLRVYKKSKNPIAHVKYTVTEYGEINEGIPFDTSAGEIINLHTSYTIKVDKIINDYNDLFPDIEGKEIKVYRAINKNTDENNKVIFSCGLNNVFPLLKEKEYYGIIWIYEYKGNKYYMASKGTYMVEDYKEVKEYTNLYKLFDAPDYEVIRKGILEKYEGIKAE